MRASIAVLERRANQQRVGRGIVDPGKCRTLFIYLFLSLELHSPISYSALQVVPGTPDEAGRGCALSTR